MKLTTWDLALEDSKVYFDKSVRFQRIADALFTVAILGAISSVVGLITSNSLVYYWSLGILVGFLLLGNIFDVMATDHYVKHLNSHEQYLELT